MATVAVEQGMEAVDKHAKVLGGRRPVVVGHLREVGGHLVGLVDALVEGRRSGGARRGCG